MRAVTQRRFRRKPISGLVRFSPRRRPISREVREAIKEDNRDRPLYLGLEPKDPEALAPLELPQPRKRITQLAQAQIISAALVAGREDLERWISYSRNYQYYNDVRHRYGDTYSYKLIVPTVDALTQAGWLENDRKPPGHYGEQSRMRATERLLGALEKVEVRYTPRESLLLHDDYGLRDYCETAETRKMRRDVAAINEGIAAYDIELRDIPFKEGLWLLNGKATLGAVRLTQYRQFQRGSTECGGRLYGASWQNLPKLTGIERGIESIGRNELKINGEPTVEHDYESLHLRLLYFKAGAPVPAGDLYDLGTWPRKYVKAAILIAINARTEHETIHALARELVGIDQKMGRNDIPAAADRLDEVRRLLRDCAAKHKPIAHFFGSDAGVRLMRTDSDLAIAVMRAMQREGITPLGVHDSFVVPETYGPKLEEVMQAELAKLDPTRTIPISAENEAVFMSDQGDSSKGNYIGVWGDGLVAPPRSCGELASAYLGF
jgi:hypothetical protein